MSVATKLEYLNDTKQLLKENINNLGGNLTTEPFRQYASVLEGIYERIPKVSGIGSNLSLSPSLMGKIKLNEIQGNTLQNGTPTPSSPVPIESVTGLQNVTISNSDNTDSNTYEVNLGKNLLDIQGIVKGRLDNGVIGYASDVSDLTLNDNSFSFTTTKNYRGVTSDYIKVNNTKYVFSNKNILFGSPLNIVVACYDNSKTFLSNAFLGSINLTYMVATLPSNTSYIRVYLYLNSAGTITIEEPQLEKGTQVSSYSPYFTPIELNKIGTYQDRIYKDNGKWYVEKNIGKSIWNGTEDWRMYLLTFTLLLNHTQGICYCNRFISKTTQPWSSGDTNNRGYISAYNLATEIKLMPTDTTIDSVEKFKTWLASNNVEVKYILATPIYEVITNTELIEQLESLYNAKSEDGTTNINVTSEDLSMILNVGVLKGE